MIGIRFALRILPHIQTFQYSSIKNKANHLETDFDYINKRLLNAGLLIYNDITCDGDDVIHINEDLLLISGIVRNQITKCVYESPIFIKHSLSKQGLKLLDDHASTKILVLPKTKINHIFTDSLLINHILNASRKQSFNQRFNTSQMNLSECMKCNRRFDLQTKTMVDSHTSLSGTDNEW